MLACGWPAQAADPFTGRWSIDPAGCTRQGNTAATSPLVLGEKTVTWHASSCTIRKTYRIGDGLYLQALCSKEGAGAKTMPIGLQLQGADRIKVTWDQTAVGEMRRCRRNGAFRSAALSFVQQIKCHSRQSDVWHPSRLSTPLLDSPCRRTIRIRAGETEWWVSQAV